MCFRKCRFRLTFDPLSESENTWVGSELFSVIPRHFRWKIFWWIEGGVSPVFCKLSPRSVIQVLPIKPRSFLAQLTEAVECAYYHPAKGLILTECPGFDTNIFHGEVTVLELCGIWSIPSLPVFLGPLWAGILNLVIVPCMGQLKLLNLLQYMTLFNKVQSNN